MIHPTPVPCVKRTSAVDSASGAEELVETPMEGEEDAWVAPAVQRTASGAAHGDYHDDDDIVDIDANGEEVVAEAAPAAGPEGEDDIPDIDDLAIEDDDEVVSVGVSCCVPFYIVTLCIMP